MFFYTKILLQNEIEEELYSNKDRVVRLLKENQTITGVPPIMMVEKVERAESLMVKDTLMYDPLQDEIELFEQLSETIKIGEQHYRVTVRAMVIESEDILFAIVFTFMVVILLAFIFLFYLNRSRNRKLWLPFFINLERLKLFSLKSNEPLQLESSDILEFDELNREMQILTNKVQIDYRNLKQFTEDVSHEMQTPLAIMQAKIENIIDQQGITKSQFEELSSLQGDIQRLKQLNKKLILLAKIDNNQFNTNESIVMNEVFKKSIKNFKDLTALQIVQNDYQQVELEMDINLATVLCNNLLSNAIKHSTSEQAIMVNFRHESVQIINSGTATLSHPDQIFERFYKESKKTDSTGLGLSIVKKICDYYGFVPSYYFNETSIDSDKNGVHTFQVDFKK